MIFLCAFVIRNFRIGTWTFSKHRYAIDLIGFNDYVTTLGFYMRHFTKNLK